MLPARKSDKTKVTIKRGGEIGSGFGGRLVWGGVEMLVVPFNFLKIFQRF